MQAFRGSGGDPEAVTRLLHPSLHHLRWALGPAGESLVTFAGGAYRLDRRHLNLDLDQFQCLAAAQDEGLRPGARAEELYRRVID